MDLRILVDRTGPGLKAGPRLDSVPNPDVRSNTPPRFSENERVASWLTTTVKIGSIKECPKQSP